MISNNQIDRLGDKLRENRIDADCLTKLEEFRSQFSNAYENVEETLIEKLGLQVTGRPSKSTVAIIEKLRRESSRLNQIQDISGCRIIVRDLLEQEVVVQNIQIIFRDSEVQDKRKDPKNGYRAIHIIVRVFGRKIEIQVRTRLQHVWAEVSEKVADNFGHDVKYGSGNKDALDFLAELSRLTEKLELLRHEKTLLIQRHLKSGKTRESVEMMKKLSEKDKLCLREIRQLFNSLNS